MASHAGYLQAQQTGKCQSSFSLITGAFRRCFVQNLAKGLFSAWCFIPVLWHVESANGCDAQPGWEACSEAQLLFRWCRQTPLLEENHSNNLVNLHPTRTHPQLATPDSSLWQTPPRWPQQLTFPMFWLFRLGPAPHTGMWPLGHHPHIVVTCPCSPGLLILCCFCHPEDNYGDVTLN